MQTDNPAGTAIDKKNNINTHNVLDKWSSSEQQSVQQRNSSKSNDKATLNVARKDKNLRKLNAGKSSVETIELPNMIGPITNKFGLFCSKLVLWLVYSVSYSSLK